MVTYYYGCSVTQRSLVFIAVHNILETCHILFTLLCLRSQYSEHARHIYYVTLYLPDGGIILHMAVDSANNVSTQPAPLDVLDGHKGIFAHNDRWVNFHPLQVVEC